MKRRGAQRVNDQARAFGRDVRLARTAAGLSTGNAANRAGVSRSTLMRVEAGSAAATLATICAVSDAVGLDLVIRAYPGRRPSLRDRGQLLIAEYLARAAHPGWNTTLEVTAGDHGQAIDQVFWGSDEILAVEIIRHMGDYQAQYRAVSLKRDWFARQHRRPVYLVLAVEDLRSNRAALAPYMGLITSSLSAGSRQIMESIRANKPLGSDGLLWVRRRQNADP